MPIDMVLAAFALSGVILPTLLGNWIAATDPARAFNLIGIASLLPGLVCIAMLSRSTVPESGAVGDSGRNVVPAPDRAFAVLTGVFFCLCFVGLAVVSQAVAMAAAGGLAEPSRAATMMILGYLAGSLIGAPLADKAGERQMLSLLSTLCGLGAAAMWTGAPLFFLAGATLVGLSFGGAGSVLPVLVGRRYGAAMIRRSMAG